MKVISVALVKGNRHHTKVSMLCRKKKLKLLGEFTEEQLFLPTTGKSTYTRTFLLSIEEPEETIVVVDRLSLFESEDGYGGNKLPNELRKSGCKLMGYWQFKQYGPSRDIRRIETNTKLSRVKSALDIHYDKYRKVPFGYRRVTLPNPEGHDIKSLEPVPEEKEVITLLYYLVCKHRNYSAVSKYMETKGYTGWTRAKIRRVVNSKVYCGYVNINGAWVLGRHKPIVSLTRWNSMQCIVFKKGRSWTNKKLLA